MDAENDKYLVVEWTIKNFSCWSSDLHDSVIRSTKILTVCEWWVELYPRGLSGKHEDMVVLLRGSIPLTFLGDLSFISSDGSVLCTLQVDSRKEVRILELPPGPNFEELVAEIREKALHEDRLTLRLRQRNNFEMVEYMRTKITAFDSFFKTSSKISDYFNSRDRLITGLRYPDDEEKMDALNLVFEQQSNDSKIALKLFLVNFQKNVSVLTRMTVLRNEDVVRTEEKEHLFRDRKIWIFCDSLSKEEVSKEGVSLNLYFKIIPSRKYKHCFGLYQIVPEFFSMSASSFKAPGTSISEERSSSSTTTGASSLTALSEELMCLYQDQDFSDLQLKCRDVSIPVHRAILGARSPVFKTMLSCDMREAASNQVDIEDLDPSTLCLFLTYLYTGTVEELQGERALMLYYAADKYQVPSLKRECADFLCGNVSISNVCDILSLANRHQDDKLMNVSNDFILNNYNEVLESDEWISFMRVDPLLAVETLTHISVQRNLLKSEI